MGRENNGEDGFTAAAHRITDLVSKAMDNLNKKNEEKSEEERVEYKIEAIVSLLFCYEKK